MIKQNSKYEMTPNTGRDFKMRYPNLSPYIETGVNLFLYSN